MNFIGSFRKRFVVFLAVCFAVIALSYIRTIAVLPNRITILEGDEYTYHFNCPFLVNVKADQEGILQLNNREIKASGSFINLSNPISMKSKAKGSVSLRWKVFGLIPLKTMQVDIMPNKKVVACGNTIGVKLKIQGILVLGLTEVETVEGKRSLPAREAGIRAGDLLVEANEKKLDTIQDLIREIENSQGNKMTLRYKRGDSQFDVGLRPVMDTDDRKYHIGLWVRDSTAGIGTLTFFDPDTMCFGALGHGITDIDTGTLMPVENGEILESRILGIKKGQAGVPGELKGVFIEDRGPLGIIHQNSNQGIYGTMAEESSKRVSDRSYPIALRTQIREGAATILANIDGSTVTEYNVTVEKIAKQNLTGTKGMVIRITDKRLLDSTGGIVQGMSGSPILQNGRIIGAVTHVLVNDPTRGYGIYIEWMLKNLGEASKTPAKKAG